MPTTVYFATNRALAGPPEDWRSYQAAIVAPSDPAAITYATAFVDNADLTADKSGAITTIQDVQQGGFQAQQRAAAEAATRQRAAAETAARQHAAHQPNCGHPGAPPCPK